MRITDSINLTEQLQETVIRMNDLFGFRVPFFTILEDNGTIRPLFDITSVQENAHSAVVIEYDVLDEWEHSFEHIQDFLHLASAYYGEVDEIYALQNAGIRHTLIFQWGEWGDETLTMVWNPITKTYTFDINFE